MLDEVSVTAILTRYFPTAANRHVADAARDLVLLELLSDDRLLVWEDSMNDRQDPILVRTRAPRPCRES
jgi:hypothetical protein